MSTQRGLAKEIIVVFSMMCYMLSAASVLAAEINPVIGKWGYSRIEHIINDGWIVESGVTTYNADGTGTQVYEYNYNGTVVRDSDIFTYTITSQPNGRYSLSLTGANFSGVSSFVISDNGNMIIQDDTDRLDNQMMVVAVRMDGSKTYTKADFNGDFYVIGYDYDSVGTDWPGRYVANSAMSDVDGNGNVSETHTWNGDGIVHNDSWGGSYAVTPDGAVYVGNNAFLSGDGNLLVSASSDKTYYWEIALAMKKDDKVYSAADLEGTWAVGSFGDESGSFNESFGIMTCDSKGMCGLSANNQKDGTVANNLLTFTLSIATDGSFGTSVGDRAPSYAGAIGNNGNAIMFNDSFNSTNLNHREIFIGVRCSQCTTTAALYDSYDENQNCEIEDFELLKAIDDWAGNILDDFDLLNLIDKWAVGSYC